MRPSPPCETDAASFQIVDLHQARSTIRWRSRMKYMLLIHDSEAAWNSLGDADRRQIMGEYRRFTEEIRTSGHYRAGSQLQPTSTATTVRVRNGKRLVTDGPFAETRE